MNGDALGAVFMLGVFFILGTWYGLYLNLTHMHRMRRWACAVSDVLDGSYKKGPTPAGPANPVSVLSEQRIS